MRRLMLKGCILTIGLLLMAVPTWAVPIETDGTTIIAIDGNADGNVTVSALSLGLTVPEYTAGYYLNGDYSDFHTLTLGVVGIDIFQGGDLIDLALRSNSDSSILTASGDLSDSSYSVTMAWDGVVCCAQQPASFSDSYYSNVLVTWNISSYTGYSDELALNFWNGNDGFAPTDLANTINGLPPNPVPEASTLLLLGSGLAALGLWNRKKRVFIR